jgi:hypothetical protein
MDKRLKNQDYVEAAKMLNCEVAALMAVASVESSGRGFDDDGRIILRFEGHKFRGFTGGKYDQSHPHLSYPYRVQHLKKHGYTAFSEAFQLDPTSALLATSYGLFQPMGFTHEECGFDDVHEFVEFLKVSERNQLIAFVGMVKFRKLADEIQRKDWAGFARNYNGKSYKDNNYDVKMAKAYQRFNKVQFFKNVTDEEIEQAIDVPAPSQPTAPEVESGNLLPVSSTLEVTEIATETKIIANPEPVGFRAKITKIFTAITGGTFSLAMLKEWLQIQISPETLAILKVLLPIILLVGGLALIVWYVSEKVTNWKLVKLQAEINSDKSRHDIEVQKK